MLIFNSINNFTTLYFKNYIIEWEPMVSKNSKYRKLFAFLLVHMNDANFVLLEIRTEACVARIDRHRFTGEFFGTILSDKRLTINRYTETVYNVRCRSLAAKINVLGIWPHLLDNRKNKIYFLFIQREVHCFYH